jgi:hypothetical protein
MRNMKYRVEKTLSRRSMSCSLSPEEVKGLLLVGEEPTAVWKTGHSRYGYDQCSLIPAIHNGARVWVLRRCWFAADGCGACGVSEEILPFEVGKEILAGKGIYDIPNFFPVENEEGK